MSEVSRLHGTPQSFCIYGRFKNITTLQVFHIRIYRRRKSVRSKKSSEKCGSEIRRRSIEIKRSVPMETSYQQINDPRFQTMDGTTFLFSHIKLSYSNQTNKTKNYIMKHKKSSDIFQNGKPPSIIVAGAGSADILMYNTTETILYTKYSEGLVKLVQPADVLSQKGTRFLWMMQDPVLEERLPNHLVGIDNRQINVCNRAAEEVRKKIFCV